MEEFVETDRWCKGDGKALVPYRLAIVRVFVMQSGREEKKMGRIDPAPGGPLT